MRERGKEKGYNRSMQIDSNEETKSEFLCQTNEVQLLKNFFLCAKNTKLLFIVVVAAVIGLLKLLNQMQNFCIRLQKLLINKS